MANTDTDRIEKKILLRAPRSRVWRALTNPEEFAAWFDEGRSKLKGDFAPGHRITYMTDGKELEFGTIERVEPEHLFSYRWVPGDPDPALDPATAVKTLVEFHLEEVPDGTLLTLVESGFDRISPERRARAFRQNVGGWAEQFRNIERYVTDVTAK